ncbi:ATPase SWSAP1 [Patella vulgata]|uniref:ATPase SWSAP1 n=1 Tax=Patella vulgata TaxID=6465 RepID=UPI0021801D53|nr:ATPase SWSAP1 [Patella vulgata]XP_050394880.1 ATPase SWSAP1 [Patella vulgata]XP_050394881.1 ATPase SWSAP1 [Patella vulgata]XP_050394882.1 ATPase SWSAP1 [Patella vulgata]
MSLLARMLPIVSPWLQTDPVTNEFIQQKILTDERNMVMFGGQKTGKTSLLFQTALSFAGEELTVMFISPQPLAKLPLTVHGLLDPNAAILKSVKFVYHSTVKELIDYCASVHMKQYYPDVIILDDLEHYISQLKSEGVDHGMAKICALLIDAASFIKQHSESGKCRMLLCLSDKYKSLPSICKQFDFNTLYIQGADTNQFDLIYKTQDNKELTSSYILTDTDIRLNHIVLKSTT